MKITNKTVGWTIIGVIGSIVVFGPFIEPMVRGCGMWDIDCGWTLVRFMTTVVIIGALLVRLGFLLEDLMDDTVQFEHEIKLPRSKRNTLNKLYSKMGEAAMRGDEREEKRLWETIQKIENR